MDEPLSMLDVHQGIKRDKERGESRPATYSPTEAEKSANELVEALLDRAKAVKEQYSQDWMKRYRFFRGQQWLKPRPDFKHAEVINMVFQAIQSSVPQQTDARPEIAYTAREPSDLEIADILTQVETAEWSSKNWLMDLTETIYDGYIYGTGLMRAGYDPDEDSGLGAITLESFDPYYLFPDPAARDINKKARYMIEAEPIDIDIVKAKYPDKAGYLEPDISDLTSYEKNSLQKPRFAYPTDKYYPTDAVEKTGYNLKDKKQQVLLITAYIKNDVDIEEVSEKVRNEDGTESTVYTQKVKYPNGRKIVKAGSVILEDGPMDCSRFPYARYVNYILPREFWGMSEVEQLESPQMIFNKLVSFALDVLTLMGNPVWIVSTDANLDTDNFTNAPGSILEPAPGSEVRRLEGVQLQPYVMQLIDRMKIWFDDISGNQEVTRGTTTGGVTAMGAIEALQEASRTRIRQKMRNMDCMLKDIGLLHQEYILENYSAPRVFRLTNKEGVTKYFKMHVDKRKDPATGKEKKYVVYQPYKQVNGKAAEDIDNVKEAELIGTFDVSVNTVSGLPFLKSERESKAFQLYDRQIIDAEELLKVIEYPNREAVLNRMKQNQAAMQEGAINAEPNAATNAA